MGGVVIELLQSSFCVVSSMWVDRDGRKYQVLFIGLHFSVNNLLLTSTG